MSTAPLFLLHTRPDPQRLALWAARHRILSNHGDMGYPIHSLLTAAFGENAPRPFRYVDDDQALLAYTHLNDASMAQHVALADPEVAAALGLGASASSAGYSLRAFPSKWEVGHTLGFSVRIRPIGHDIRTGQERDVSLAAVERSNGAPLDRHRIYLDWFCERLDKQGGARLCSHDADDDSTQAHDAQVTHYRLLDVVRKTQKTAGSDVRKNKVITGPDVIIQGHLQVTDTEKFAALLSGGIGRHKAFGYGLLLLRPAAR
jgi:CRISPR system Cascade subunit CasE